MCLFQFKSQENNCALEEVIFTHIFEDNTQYLFMKKGISINAASTFFFVCVIIKVNDDNLQIPHHRFLLHPLEPQRQGSVVRSLDLPLEVESLHRYRHTV